MRKGYYTTDQGYIKIIKPKEHPAKGRYVFLHRLIIEEKIGRYLRPEERVHHKDGNKLNNAPENLHLFANQSEHGKEGSKAQRKYLVLWNGEWLHQEYVVKKRTMSDIADELGCKDGTVRNAIIKRGFEHRRYTLTPLAIKFRRKGGQAKKTKRRQ